MNIKFYLKEPKKAESLLLMFCRWNGNVIKLSTRHRIECKTWNAEKQRCVVSKSKFCESRNAVCESTNRFLKELMEAIHSYVDSENFHETITTPSTAKEHIERQIESLVDAEEQNLIKLQQTPIEFFKEYVERKRIDTHTGRYIGERTKIHQRTVIHRLELFLVDTRLPNDFSTFTSKKFDAQFTEWCYFS